ncbi:MAG: helix-turn-helix domain-containing protein [Pseudomonadota bacterium]
MAPDDEEKNMNNETTQQEMTTKPSAPVTFAYMTVLQYGEHRQVSRTTIYGWIKAGLPTIKQGRTRRIRVEVADAWLDAGNASLATHVKNRSARRTGGSHA